MRFIWATLLCLMAADGNAAAAPLHLLKQFIGEWHSGGDAFGSPARSRMVWYRGGPGDRFIRLEYRIETTAKDVKTGTFEGTAYYQTSTAETVQAIWADSNGSLHPITAAQDGAAIVAHWGSETTEQGRTRYDLQAPDRMQVTDWVKTPAGWRQFNQNTYARKKQAPQLN